MSEKGSQFHMSGASGVPNKVTFSVVVLVLRNACGCNYDKQSAHSGPDTGNGSENAMKSCVCLHLSLQKNNEKAIERYAILDEENKCW